MLEDPRFWVTVAFVVFVALSYKKVMGWTIGLLDERSAKIKAELEEAKRLRMEAEQVLHQYKQKQAEYLKESEIILANAQKDAQTLRSFSEAELKNTLDGRMKQAIERIAQEESNAITEVRDYIIHITLAATRALIRDSLDDMPQDETLKLALTEIERKIH